MHREAPAGARLSLARTRDRWPPGDGEMARRVREHEWSTTALGSKTHWPQSLRVAVRLVLDSRHPMFIWWGEDLIQIYNDAYRETMGPEKHPSALGRSGRETWSEIWDVIGPQIEHVMSGGPATWHEDHLVPVTRHGRREMIWWTYGFSPIEEDEAPTSVGGVIVICRDVTVDHLARVAASELAASEARQRALLEGIPQLVWRAVDAGRWTWASPQWTEFTGQSDIESRGWGWLEPLHPEDRDRARSAWRDAEESGGFDVEYRIRRKVERDYRWFQTRAVPVVDNTGIVVEWLGTSTDIHDLREMQDRQRVLLEELQHRTRNLMGIVRSISARSIACSTDLADFRARFDDRLIALARVQGLLSRLDEWDRVTFDELLRSELSALDGEVERITLDGPKDVPLRSSSVQTFALALHELITNALKHGALAQPQGRLSIVWRRENSDADDQPWLHVAWRESDVQIPSSRPPLGRGAGRELIEQALPYQLGAKTSFEILADGVYCTIALPVSGRRAT